MIKHRTQWLAMAAVASLTWCACQPNSNQKRQEDSAENALPSLQMRIDSCSTAGGGKVVVAPGEYRLAGPLWLRNDVELHLKEGATLLFSGRADDFLPVVFTRWEGTELMGRCSMIHAENAHNISITGKGVIDAQGGVEMAAWGMVPGESAFEENVHGTHGETVEMPDVRRLREMGDNGTPLEERVFGEGTHLRPCAIEFVNCNNVTIEGITLKNSPFWCIHPLYCSHVTVREVTIDSHYPNNDGCDPESSDHVLIENCVFQTGDDAVAIKSGRDADGRKIGRPAEHITVRNCVFRSECNGLCIGSEMSGGVSDIVMENVAIGPVKNALLFKSNLDRGGYIRNVTVRNVSIESVEGAVLRFETNYFGYRGGHFPAKYENFNIENVMCDKAKGYAIYYDGNDEAPISNIALRNFNVSEASVDHYLFHTENCTFDNCLVNGKLLPHTLTESAERQSCDVW